MSNVQKMALLGKRYNAEKQSHGDSDRFNAESPKRQNVALEENSHLTAKRIGDEMNVSSRTVERAAKFVAGMDAAEEVLPGITKEIISGEIKPTDMIDSFRADGEKLIRAMEFYFEEFPEILTEKQYKDLADVIFIRVKTEIEKYLYGNFSNSKIETSTESEVITDDYSYADFEGTFNATLDLKKQGKSNNILGFFTLGDGKKIVASAWESDNYLGLSDIETGAKVTLTFKKMKSGNSYLTDVTTKQ